MCSPQSVKYRTAAHGTFDTGVNVKLPDKGNILGAVSNLYSTSTSFWLSIVHVGGVIEPVTFKLATGAENAAYETEINDSAHNVFLNMINLLIIKNKKRKIESITNIYISNT